jgi:hypothetical protein
MCWRPLLQYLPSPTGPRTVYNSGDSCKCLTSVSIDSITCQKASYLSQLCFSVSYCGFCCAILSSLDRPPISCCSLVPLNLNEHTRLRDCTYSQTRAARFCELQHCPLAHKKWLEEARIGFCSYSYIPRRLPTTPT